MDVKELVDVEGYKDAAEFKAQQEIQDQQEILVILDQQVRLKELFSQELILFQIDQLLLYQILILLLFLVVGTVVLPALVDAIFIVRNS